MQNNQKAFFNRRFWTILSTIQFEEFESEVTDEIKLGPEIDLTAHISFEPAHLAPLVEKKKDYLEASKEERVTEAEALDAVAEDVATALDIVFNQVGYTAPDEGVYQKINDEQWRKVDTETYYSDYTDILWDITAEKEHLPSIPGLYREFLLAVSDSDEHSIPPEGVVEDILSEHIEQMRAERQSRTAVTAAKRELEQRGVQPRTAASVAKSLDPYLKTDNEIESLKDE